MTISSFHPVYVSVISLMRRNYFQILQVTISYAYFMLVFWYMLCYNNKDWKLKCTFNRTCWSLNRFIKLCIMNNVCYNQNTLRYKRNYCSGQNLEWIWYKNNLCKEKLSFCYFKCFEYDIEICLVILNYHRLV